MVGLYESRLNVLEFSGIKFQDLAKTKIKAYMVMRSIDRGQGSPGVSETEQISAKWKETHVTSRPRADETSRLPGGAHGSNRQLRTLSDLPH